ncbi:MAG: hypothetical protein M3304_02620, partial [Actinomycetota bacterium]|nr:hypothetical protein [Actinomycetota bacterium]
ARAESDAPQANGAARASRQSTRLGQRWLGRRELERVRAPEDPTLRGHAKAKRRPALALQARLEGARAVGRAVAQALEDLDVSSEEPLGRRPRAAEH